MIRLINTSEHTFKLRQNLDIEFVEPLENYNIFHFNKTIQENRKKNCLAELNLTDTPIYIKDKLQTLCTKYNDLFAFKTDIPTCKNFYKQKINLNDPTPVYIKKLQNTWSP